MNNNLIEFSNVNNTRNNNLSVNKKIKLLVFFNFLNLLFLISLLALNVLIFINDMQINTEASNISDNLNLISSSNILNQIELLINYTCTNIIDCK